MKYPVALLATGCWSQGSTEEEALENIRVAIREYLDVAKQLAGDGNARDVKLPVH
jgi:predicted RNase H-like HicB family nuclease